MVLAFLGVAHPPVLGTPDDPLEFEAHELEKLRLDDLPILLEHEPEHGVAGKIVTSFFNHGRLWVVGQLSDDTPVGRQCQQDLESGRRKELSITHDAFFRVSASADGRARLVIEKQPREVRFCDLFGFLCARLVIEVRL
jgi:hypothetical protein